MENRMRLSQKINNQTNIWSSNPNTGCLPKGNLIKVLRRHVHSHVYYSTSHTIAKLSNQPKCSINTGIKKISFIYLKKKRWYPVTCNNKDGCGEHCVKWNKPGTGRQTLWFHLYVKSNKVDLIEVEGRVVITSSCREWQEGEEGEVG